MKKWLVRIQYTESIDTVNIIYAKNKYELESFVNECVKDILELIDGYEYDELSRGKISSYKWQKKNECVPYSFCGTWVGVGCIKECLENE